MSKQHTVKIKTGSYDLSTLAQLSTLEPLFKRDYYLLTSWNSEPNGGGTRLDPSTNVQNDMSAYALWKPVDYSITYKLDGGTNGSNPTSYNIESETSVLQDATKFQHVFDKWTENGSLVTAIATGSHGDKTLSASYTRTKVTARYECNYGYTKVTYNDGTSEWLGIKGVLLDDIFQARRQDITECLIGEAISSIGYNAFNSCTMLSNVTIPSSVKIIGEGSFGSCIRLTSVVIPVSVINIGTYAFNSCTSLKSMTILDSVKSIGEDAFYMCGKTLILTFANRTLDDVKNIEDGNGKKYYPWGLNEDLIVPGVK